MLFSCRSDGVVVPVGKSVETGVVNPHGYTLNYNGKNFISSNIRLSLCTATLRRSRALALSTVSQNFSSPKRSNTFFSFSSQQGLYKGAVWSRIHEMDNTLY